MIIDADYVYEGLLQYNYFPMVKENRDDIVPVFTSEDFTTRVANSLIATMGASGKKDGYDQIEYRTTRFNNVLRLMHIPHPYPFANLCKCIHDNWSRLDYICTNNHSQIKPAYHGGGRVVVISDYDSVELGRVVVMERDHFPDDMLLHIGMSNGAQYLVNADVSSCFPSLYSHAIPWALVGHELAKRNRRDSEWFNTLDVCQRNLKRGETQGVPVGPATSNIINEVVLSRVDEALAAKGYRFLRFIDDFNCYCETREKAELFIRDLEQELSRYLLSLNAKKVSILDLPMSWRDVWVTELSMHLPGDGDLSARQIASIIDYSLALQRSHPEGSILKYAARALVKRVNKSNVNIYIQYLLQIAFHYPAILPIISEVMAKYLVSIDECYARAVTRRHLAFRRSDAVCWSLYTLFLAQREVGGDLADDIVASRDCIAMAMLLSINEDEYVDKVQTFIRTLRGQHHYELDKYWILIYELTRRGVLKEADLGNYFSESGFQILAQNDVQFIRLASSMNVCPETVSM